jgi:hypothetical protein
VVGFGLAEVDVIGRGKPAAGWVVEPDRFRVGAVAVGANLVLTRVGAGGALAAERAAFFEALGELILAGHIQLTQLVAAGAGRSAGLSGLSSVAAGGHLGATLDVVRATVAVAAGYRLSLVLPRHRGGVTVALAGVAHLCLSVAIVPWPAPVTPA